MTTVTATWHGLHVCMLADKRDGMREEGESEGVGGGGEALRVQKEG